MAKVGVGGGIEQLIFQFNTVFSILSSCVTLVHDTFGEFYVVVNCGLEWIFS